MSESPITYPSLANTIGVEPDFGIFRKFLSLNAWNLLRMQGELVHLGCNLKIAMDADSHSTDQQRSLNNISMGTLRKGGLQYELARELEQKLASYSLPPHLPFRRASLSLQSRLLGPLKLITLFAPPLTAKMPPSFSLNSSAPCRRSTSSTLPACVRS